MRGGRMLACPPSTSHPFQEPEAHARTSLRPDARVRSGRHRPHTSGETGVPADRSRDDRSPRRSRGRHGHPVTRRLRAPDGRRRTNSRMPSSKSRPAAGPTPRRASRPSSPCRRRLVPARDLGRRHRRTGRGRARQRFGVGEVFIYVAGQSNSSNYGEVKAASMDERVAAFDGETWSLAADPMPGVQDGSTGGSPWPQCGKDLVAAWNMPVAFASCGFGGTSVLQWQKTAAPLDGKKAPLYGALLQRAQGAGQLPRDPGWHQGESDAAARMSSADYASKFRELRDALTKRTQASRPTGSSPTSASCPNSTRPDGVDPRGAAGLVEGEGRASGARHGRPPRRDAPQPGQDPLQQGRPRSARQALVERLVLLFPKK